MTYNNVLAVIARAVELLPCRTSVGRNYAADVLWGRSAWSGADLQGAAKKYWRSYAERRDDARRALRAAGGCVVAVGDAGELRSAVYVGQDDYGDAIYHVSGLAVAMPRQRASKRLRIV